MLLDQQAANENISESGKIMTMTENLHLSLDLSAVVQKKWLVIQICYFFIMRQLLFNLSLIFNSDQSKTIKRYLCLGDVERNRAIIKILVYVVINSIA